MTGLGPITVNGNEIPIVHTEVTEIQLKPTRGSDGTFTRSFRPGALIAYDGKGNVYWDAYRNGHWEVC